VISGILAAAANNFGILWPQYWTQYGFTGTAPTVQWYFGPRYKTVQTAVNQIVVMARDEQFVGAETHSTMPYSDPRELSRLWTRLDFYCWGQPSTLPSWAPSTVTALLAPLSPTTINQNGNWFQCSTNGTTGLTEPVWPSTVGLTVTDGSVVWTCMGPVDAFRVYDTDVADLMRLVVAATMHYTAVGSYRPLRSTWYDSSDQLVMSGFTNRVSFEVLIPVVDVNVNTAIINSTAITAAVTTQAA
jgi:hypothetical protein